MNSSRDSERATDAIEEPRSRRDMLRNGGAAAVAALLGVFGVATTTAAKNGSPIRAGEKNFGH